MVWTPPSGPAQPSHDKFFHWKQMRHILESLKNGGPGPSLIGAQPMNQARKPDYMSFSPEQLLGPLNEVERVNAPEMLYAAGDIELLRGGRRVSVVGSRKVSAAGITRTQALAKALVERGAVVVSGLAEGVDTAAHKTDLSRPEARRWP